MPIQSICVFLGSSAGSKAAYADAARELGRVLAVRGITTVYGGGNVGLMGILADSVLRHQGTIKGVIPQILEERELAHQDLSELHIAADMHERKKLMAHHSDAFIALPGGLGTLEEVFEALTWNQIGVHAKPCGLLNVEGYYDSLLRFLDHALAEGFISKAVRQMILSHSDPQKLVDVLEGTQDLPKAKFT